MPELPEVELVVRELKKDVPGQTIQSVDISDVVTESKARGREAIIKGRAVDDFIESMRGRTITALERKSKYIYFTLDDGEQLLVNHLGMTGAWFVVDSVESITEEKYRKHAHAIFHLEDGRQLIYSDIRRFGELRLLQEESDYPPLLKLAPEPFDERAEQYFIEQAASDRWKEKPIKTVIMDGTVVSGCGNIYATEALFRRRIHPNRTTSRISEAEQRALFREIVTILQESIDRGGSTISDYQRGNGETGEMQHFHQMYKKKTCPVCLRPTRSMSINNRTSTYCPSCQK